MVDICNTCDCIQIKCIHCTGSTCRSNVDIITCNNEDCFCDERNGNVLDEKFDDMAMGAMQELGMPEDECENMLEDYHLMFG